MRAFRGFWAVAGTANRKTSVGVMRANCGIDEHISMSDQEKETEIEELEAKFPSLSGNAFSVAFFKAQHSGQTVLVSERGALYRVQPNGTRTFMKTIEPPTKVELDKKIRLR